MDGIRYEELFKRVLVCAHEMEKAVRRSERFDDWSAIEILALRAFQRVPNHALGATELARRLRCSVTYASKMMRRLRGKGLLEEGTSYRTFRSMVLTPEGLERVQTDAECLETFARGVFAPLSDEECRQLLVHLGRVLAGRDRGSGSIHSWRE